MENLLEVKNLRVSFKTFFGEVEAVRDISYNVKKGKTLAKLGNQDVVKAFLQMQLCNCCQIHLSFTRAVR